MKRGNWNRLEKVNSFSANSVSMFFNCFKIAWRILQKRKLFSFINILGLSAGLTCCMLITMYIFNETSYDAYHRNADNIYQVAHEITGLGELKLASAPAATGELMKSVFPEIEQTTRLATMSYAEDKTLVSCHVGKEEEHSFYEKVYLADPSFFRMFTYDFIRGDATTSLSRPGTVVLSEEMAKKLLGITDALGKVIHVSSVLNGEHDYIVTGVFRPFDSPSHIDAKIILSIMGGGVEEAIKRQGTNIVSDFFYYTYLQLRPGSSAANLQAKFPSFMNKYAGKDQMGFSYKVIPFLIPLKSIHLEEDLKAAMTESSSKKGLYILGSVAFFTLLIACFNFMNLMTAQSSKRSAEVGLRKVFGAERKSLITQFLSESLLMSLIALLAAYLLTFMLIPLFSSLAGKSLSFSLLSDWKVVVTFLGLTVMTGFIAGSYPAFYLSSFIPVKVLNGKFSASFSAAILRKGLVILQFSISVIMIIASIVIGRQLRFLQRADLGFDKDRQMIVSMRSQSSRKAFAAVADQLLKLPAVRNVGGSVTYPGHYEGFDKNFYKDGESPDQKRDIKINYIDTRYLQTLNIRLLAGRLFSNDFYTADTTANALVINEAATQSLGFSKAQDAISRTIHSFSSGRVRNYIIVGVVKNFNFEDLHVAIGPCCFILNTPPEYNYMTIHVAPGNLQASIGAIGNTWKNILPSEPMDYSLLDEGFQQNYDGENKLFSLIKGFTVIAIFISCLGLYALAKFSAGQRIREICVRKVLGASKLSIVTLISKDFLKLTGIALLAGGALAWLIMNKWLQTFAYRITISWAVFAITIVIVFFIALLTISFQIIRAAAASPAKTLRSE